MVGSPGMKVLSVPSVPPQRDFRFRALRCSFVSPSGPSPPPPPLLLLPPGAKPLLVAVYARYMFQVQGDIKWGAPTHLQAMETSLFSTNACVFVSLQLQNKTRGEARALQNFFFENSGIMVLFDGST